MEQEDNVMQIDEPSSTNKPIPNEHEWADLDSRLGAELEDFIIQGSHDDPRERKPRATPGEELEKVQVDQARPDHEVIISSTILDELLGEVINFFKKFFRCVCIVA